MKSLLSPDRNGSWDQAGMVRSLGRFAEGLLVLLFARNDPSPAGFATLFSILPGDEAEMENLTTETGAGLPPALISFATKTVNVIVFQDPGFMRYPEGLE